MNIEKNRRVIAKEGGIEVILDCLRNALSNPSVLIAASWSLRNIAVDGIILFSFFFFFNKFFNKFEKKKKTSKKKLFLKKRNRFTYKMFGKSSKKFGTSITSMFSLTKYFNSRFFFFFSS